MKYVALIRPLDDFQNYTLNIGRRYGKYAEKEPAIGHHCTLMVSKLNESAEDKLVSDLETITQSQFAAELTGELDLFDGMALVARVKRSPALHELHRQVIERMRHHIDWAETGRLLPQYESQPERAKVFHAYGTPYCGPFYNPHISLAELNPNILKDPHLIQNKKLVMNKIPAYAWSVFDFELVKKKEGEWLTVRSFALK